MGDIRIIRMFQRGEVTNLASEGKEAPWEILELFGCSKEARLDEVSEFNSVIPQ